MTTTMTVRGRQAPSLTALVAIFAAADAGGTSLVSCLIADLCVCGTRLNTCNTLYVFCFLSLTAAQTLLCLHGLCQRLRHCLSDLCTVSAETDPPLPQSLWIQRCVAHSGRFLVKSVVINAGFFAIIALCVSGGTYSARSLDDVDDAAERCYWYSAPVGYITSSVLYVMTTQLTTTLVPTVCLFVVEAACAGRIRYLSVARETRRVPDTEVGGAGTSPVVEPPSSPRRNQGSLPRVKSSVTAGRPSVYTLCWRLAEDVVCLSVLLCYRIAFCTCSCDSFKVYGVLMTGLLGLSAAKLILFACLCWRFI